MRTRLAILFLGVVLGLSAKGVKMLYDAKAGVTNTLPPRSTALETPTSADKRN